MPNRTESVRLALAALGDADFVLVHDAARPLTPPSLIVRVVEALRAGAARRGARRCRSPTPSRPWTPTASCSARPSGPGCAPCRRPQGFAPSVLRARLSSGAGGGGVHRRRVAGRDIGGQVQVVEGDPLAFKITTPLDLMLAEALLAA